MAALLKRVPHSDGPLDLTAPSPRGNRLIEEGPPPEEKEATMQNKDRERAITEIVSRIVNRHIQEANQTVSKDSVSESILELVNETFYEEKKRLRTEKSTRMREDDRAFWSKVKRTLPHANDRQIKEMLSSITERFAGEVAGNFNPRIYEMSVKVVPFGLSLLLNGLSLSRFMKDPTGAMSLDTNIHIQGEVRQLQELQKRGTIVMVPTHISNLDSPVIGYSIYNMGLPPFTYGAGLNLFHNRMLGFFMRNLGAYRVDRRKKAQLYKEVLKEYATLSMEYGYNNLFFPGGTRNRLGEIERKLKKGLLGTSLQAYTHNLQRGKPNPNLYVVPVTLNYHLVLEASTLIEDALKEAGKRRYIIEDDESSDASQIYQFMSKMASLDAPIHIVVGQAYDPFGNRVDMEGRSYDRRGREIDITRYVMRDGEPVVDLQRDREYTNEVGERIKDEFASNNMILNTHLLAHTCFQMLQEKNPDMNLYRLLHTGGFVDHLAIQEVYQRVENNLDTLKAMESRGEIRIGPNMHSVNVQDLVKSALRIFGSYHRSTAIKREGDWLVSDSLNLLYYYNNRLNGYDLKANSVPTVLSEKRAGRPEAEESSENGQQAVA